jgi:cytochrome c oxidase cbb3-type subunit 2
MAGDIYRKPVSFAILAAVTVLIGSVVTMAYPMFRPEMHAKLDDLRAFTPLELAGRDVYQREGCVGCHTQTVRPLKSEVLRYGDYSKAGEFYFDRPFLWGSKRTGPDLAREGGKRPDAWHAKHYADPQAVTPRSNMPRYAFLADARLDPAEVKTHYQVLASVSPRGQWQATDADFAALAPKTEMEALIAYTQWLGHAVQKRQGGGGAIDLAAVNPFRDSPQAIARGAKVYEENCAVCHGPEGHGENQIAPDLMDDQFLGDRPDMPDGAYFGLISGGSDAKPALGRKGLADGGMTAFGGQIPDDDLWAVIAWIRAQQAHEKKELPGQEKAEHQQGGKH